MENNVIQIEKFKPLSYISEVPILSQANHFLECAGRENGIKLTDKGFLNRNFVQDFWECQIKNDEDSPFKPTREFECPEVSRIHFLLAETKYVRKSKKAIVLTQKGIAELKKADLSGLYRDLFFAGLYSWNWSFEDRYPDHEFIQNAGPTAISVLLKYPAEAVSSEQIFNEIFDVPEDAMSDSDELYGWCLSKELHRCFNVRFFRRFCLPFGLIEKFTYTGLHWEPTDEFKKTKFFTH